MKAKFRKLKQVHGTLFAWRNLELRLTLGGWQVRWSVAWTGKAGDGKLLPCGNCETKEFGSLTQARMYLEQYGYTVER